MGYEAWWFPYSFSWDEPGTSFGGSHGALLIGFPLCTPMDRENPGEKSPRDSLRLASDFSNKMHCVSRCGISLDAAFS